METPMENMDFPKQLNSTIYKKRQMSGQENCHIKKTRYKSSQYSWRG